MYVLYSPINHVYIQRIIQRNYYVFKTNNLTKNDCNSIFFIFQQILCIIYTFLLHTFDFSLQQCLFKYSRQLLCRCMIKFVAKKLHFNRKYYFFINVKKKRNNKKVGKWVYIILWLYYGKGRRTIVSFKKVANELCLYFAFFSKFINPFVLNTNKIRPYRYG